MRCMIVKITSSATADLAELFAQRLVKESVKERIADVVNLIEMVEIDRWRFPCLKVSPKNVRPRTPRHSELYAV